jgi:hypothetical protein
MLKQQLEYAKNLCRKHKDIAVSLNKIFSKKYNKTFTMILIRAKELRI